MKADYTSKNNLNTIILDVNTEELSIIITGIQQQLNKQKDYLQFYRDELVNPVLNINLNLEIEKCNAKVKQLEEMLSIV